ncbi:MAG: hypothetical protein GY870_06410 [archaeon]|nr:hypothetical protein [archaeon]
MLKTDPYPQNFNKQNGYIERSDSFMSFRSVIQRKVSCLMVELGIYASNSAIIVDGRRPDPEDIIKKESEVFIIPCISGG